MNMTTGYLTGTLFEDGTAELRNQGKTGNLYETVKYPSNDLSLYTQNKANYINIR